MAWFSVTTEKTNTFIQGDGITEPDKKPDPIDPETGQGESGEDNDLGDKWIIETEWVDNSAAVPNSIIAKNPNVGIGKTSKDAYVFVEIENGLGSNAYFVLGKNWAPVTGAVTTYNLDKDVTIDQADYGRCYTEGLFVYVGPNSAANDESGMAELKHDAANLLDKYTGEVFTKIYTNNDFSLNQSGTIEVKAFLASATAKEQEAENLEKTKKEILDKAKAWSKANPQ